MIIAFIVSDCLRQFSVVALNVYCRNITFFDMLKKQPLDQQNR
ncbi:hypothetical protein HMPREF1144_3226 [Klebsiella sp. OBRC7]|nr:hypothetical protein HMPREF1144_3226 [Klebsiella sp. OBRC7]